MKNRILTFFLLSLSAVLLLSDCAQVGTLTGGDKDTIPPAVIATSPELYAVNYRENSIRFSFDEFFVLDNMRSNFYSSPPLNEYPEFKIKRKDLIVKFPEDLKDSVTYFFNFGTGIKDYTEGNKLNNFSFVFATGEAIDSLKIKGRLLKAYSLDPEIKVPVFLYRKLNDSVPAQKPPYYYTLTDSSGFFAFNYIRPGKYKIFSLQDNDNNLLFNLPNERIAFLDSFLVPELSRTVLPDTFKAGSAVDGDTLITDSIFNRTEYNYSPDNVHLFSFLEDHKKQYIKNFERPLPGKLVFNYNIPVSKAAVDFPFAAITGKDTLIQYTDSLSKQVVWIKDNDLAAQDSIYAHAGYQMIDSLGGVSRFTDSLLFLNPKKREDSSVLKKLTYEVPEKTGYFEALPIQFDAPLKSWDTARIDLVQLIDTAVEDPKIQNLNSYGRPERDQLFFKFERSVDSFSLQLISTNDLLPFEKNSAADSVYLSLDETLASKDTLELVIAYDNEYFFSQTQHFTDTLIISYMPQRVTYTQRSKPEILQVHFAKSLKKKPIVKDINSGADIAYKTRASRQNRFFSLRFTQPEVIQKDTLMLEISCTDGPYPDGETQQFSKEFSAVFVPERQYIKKAERVSRQGFYLLFNRLVNPDNVNVTDTAGNNIQPILAEEDSLYFDNIRWKSLDTLSIKVNYLNERKTYENKSFDLFVETKKKEIRRRDNLKDEPEPSDDMQKITIEKFIPYTIRPDTADYLTFRLESVYDSLYNYRLDADSAAFIDIFERTSEPGSSKFTILGEDDYGTVKIGIKNIGNIERESFYRLSNKDSTGYHTLEKGRLLFFMYDEKGEFLNMKSLKRDSVLTYKRMLPGSYKLKAVWDENNDKGWNTGNYFENRQPERVLNFPKQITVKAGWEMNYEWRILFNETF